MKLKAIFYKLNKFVKWYMISGDKGHQKADQYHPTEIKSIYECLTLIFQICILISNFYSVF